MSRPSASTGRNGGGAGGSTRRGLIANGSDPLASRQSAQKRGELVSPSWAGSSPSCPSQAAGQLFRWITITAQERLPPVGLIFVALPLTMASVTVTVTSTVIVSSARWSYILDRAQTCLRSLRSTRLMAIVSGMDPKPAALHVLGRTCAL